MPRRAARRALRPAAERDSLVQLHWRLVPWAVGRYVASDIRRRHEHRLISAAAMGLVKAASYYDASTGRPFSTLAAIAMRQRLAAEMRAILAEPNCASLLLAGRGLPDVPDARPGPLEMAERADEVERVRRAVKRLPANYCQVVEAHLAGVPPARVALVKGVSASAVRQLLPFALRRLRRLLGPQ